MKRKGFTLAEMMIVLLIVSIITAAMLPVMTKRQKDSDTNQYWEAMTDATQGIDARVSDSQTVAIGNTTNALNATTKKSKLLINMLSNAYNHITFEQGGVYTGRLALYSTGTVALGNNTASGGLNGAVAIGSSTVTASNSVGIGALTNVSGSNSVALGYNLTSSGTNSISIGNGSTAPKSSSIAIGDTVTVSGAHGVAIGVNTSVDTNSTAIGSYSTVTGGNGEAFGHATTNGLNSFSAGGAAYDSILTAVSYTQALGDYTVALGNGASAIGQYSTALGYDALANASASGDVSYRTAVGPHSTASGQYSSAFGGLTTASGLYSTALGYGASAKAESSLAIGSNAHAANIITANDSMIPATANDKYSVAMGAGTTATGESSVAIGTDLEIEQSGSYFYNSTTANGKYTLAVGPGAGSFGEGAVSLGYSTAKAAYSTALGSGSIVENEHSIAIGGATVAAESSIVMGYKSSTKAPMSIVIGNAWPENGWKGASIDSTDGYGSILIGSDGYMGENSMYSVGLGTSVNIGGSHSIAIGDQATASGGEAIAIGSAAKNLSGDDTSYYYLADTSIAIGAGAFSIGESAIAIGDGATAGNEVIGYYVRDTWCGSAPPHSCKKVTPAPDTAKFAGHSIAIGRGASAASNSLAIGEGAKANAYASGAIGFLTTNDTPYTIKVGYDIIGHFYDTSDRRLKNVGDEFNDGLFAIRQLQPYHFTLKEDKLKTPRVGIMAQDLKKIFPEAIKYDTKGYMSIRQDDMFYAMINSIKELDKSVQSIKSDLLNLGSKVLAIMKVDKIQSAKIKQLEVKNNALQAKNNALANQNKMIMARLARLEKRVH